MPARRRQTLDPLISVERRHAHPELVVAALERRAALDRAADARAELQHLHLHRDDPREHHAEQRNPGPPADQPIEERVVRQRTDERQRAGPERPPGRPARPRLAARRLSRTRTVRVAARPELPLGRLSRSRDAARGLRGGPRAEPEPVAAGCGSGGARRRGARAVAARRPRREYHRGRSLGRACAGAACGHSLGRACAGAATAACFFAAARPAGVIAAGVIVVHLQLAGRAQVR